MTAPAIEPDGGKRRGRPPIPTAARKRNNITIRIRDALRLSLETAAVQHQRSLSEEAENRLERSFDHDAIQRRLDEILALLRRSSTKFPEFYLDGNNQLKRR